MILVSACLLGENCKYHGGHNFCPQVAEYVKARDCLCFCPETAGGLPIPRPPIELPQGDAQSVLNNQLPALDSQGQDVSAALIEGARQTLVLCRKHGVELAILKENSPSCGVRQVYDGSFIGRKIQGEGLTTALLRQAGVKVISEQDIINAGR